MEKKKNKRKATGSKRKPRYNSDFWVPVGQLQFPVNLSINLSPEMHTNTHGGEIKPSTTHSITRRQNIMHQITCIREVGG